MARRRGRKRHVSNTDVRDIMRGVARAAKAAGNEELHAKASQSAALVVGRGWSSRVQSPYYPEVVRDAE